MMAMRPMHRILSALRSLLRRDTVENDLDEELRGHLELQAADYVRGGMSLEAAIRRARLDLGGTEQVKERVRAGWFGAHVEGLWLDVRHGVRVLRRQIGFTAVAVLTLGLGIGATTAIFNLVNGVLLRPLPYRAPDRLAQIRVDFPDHAGYPGLTRAELREFGDHSRLFEGFGAAVGYTVSLTRAGAMEQVSAAAVTDNLFPLLGVEPVLGRSFGPQDRYTEQRGYRGVLISHGLWQRRFGGDPSVLGKTLEIDNVARTVLGVMPRGFRLLMGPGTFIPPDVDVWTPQDVSDRFLHVHAWRTVGRLREGVSVAQADGDLARLGTLVFEKYPDAFENEQVLFHADPLHGDIVQNMRPALLTLFGAVGFLLLIACANVTNLLLTHTEGRRKEIVLRATLGASRARILRQLMIESGLLAIAGGATGLLIARWALHIFVDGNPTLGERAGAISLDATVLGFACVAALLTSIIVGVFPALQACRRDPSEIVRERGGAAGRDGRRWVRDTLVIAEIAVSLILLVGAGLMSRTLIGLLRVDLGFEPSHVLTMRVPVNAEAYETREERWEYYRRVLRQVAASPGVERVGGIRRIPLAGDQFAASYAWDDETAQSFGIRSATYDWVLPGYFRSMGIPLLTGRGFEEHDNEPGRLLVVIDETLARQAWPGEDAVGRRLMVDADFGRDDRRWAKVIGIVRHVRSGDIRETGRPQIYLPYGNIGSGGGTSMVLTVRTADDPALHTVRLRREVEGLGGGRPVHTVRLLGELVSDARSDSRFLLSLMSAFAICALVMSLIGTYGVVRYTVSQRTHEFGIRAALGARGPDIIRLVLGRGVWLIVAGLSLGLAGAFGVTRLLRGLLYQVSATDPVTFLAVTLFLSATVLAACWLPARRAARVDPVTAIRCD